MTQTQALPARAQALLETPTPCTKPCKHAMAQYHGLAGTEPGRRPLPADGTEAMQQAAEAAIAALKRPASLRIFTNRCPNLGAAAKGRPGCRTRGIRLLRPWWHYGTAG